MCGGRHPHPERDSPWGPLRTVSGAVLARSAIRDGGSFRGIAAEAGLTPATAAVAWVLANPQVTARDHRRQPADQLEDSLAAVDTRFDPSLKQRLDELSAEYRLGDSAR